MITVLKINKQGNKILSYTCTDGKNNKDISKEQLIQYIDAKQVTNAKKQIYKGSTIIRVKEIDTAKPKNIVSNTDSKISIEALVTIINNMLVKINNNNNIYAAIFNKYGKGNGYSYDKLYQMSLGDISLGWIIELDDNIVVSGMDSIKVDKTAFNDFFTCKNKVHRLNNKYFNEITGMIHKYFGSDTNAVVLKSDKYIGRYDKRPDNENEDTYSIEKTTVDGKNYVIIHCLGVLKYREASYNTPKHCENITIGSC